MKLGARHRILDRRISVAPMMDYTDRHCRYLHRLISPTTLLYTEMVTAHALAHGHVERLLGFDPAESPVALQLGGSDPALLARAARLGEQRGYAEINLNVGCPSDRVQEGNFGACLMAEPQLVADCLSAMLDAVRLPVTVKCRIGIDEHDDYGFLHAFVAEVAAAGCATVIVHARKAVLKGLSPKENREVPPLVYERAWWVKRDFPSLTVIVNGGLRTVPQVTEQLGHVDGVMLGREAYHNPYLLPALHRAVHGDDFVTPEPASITRSMLIYAEREMRAGTPLRAITRHMMGLFAGRAGARAWRRMLSEGASRPGAGPALMEAALSAATRLQ